MEYKVLVTISVPSIEEKFEMYLPVNKYIGDINFILSKIFNDVSKVCPVKKNALLCSVDTGLSYNPQLLLRDTDIRNGSELIFI